MILGKRYHLMEINDQKWWPQFLRERVQDTLTLLWIFKIPLIQSISPAALAARILIQILGPHISDYVYIDFASGAGGPTPYIEKIVNEQLEQDRKPRVNFLLSDISPHVSAWDSVAKKSPNLSYISESVDATNAPKPEVLLQECPEAAGKKVMRLFSLAFHHFDDDLAAKVLQNTIETSHGFCIFELQARTVSSLITVTLLWPLLYIMTPFISFSDPTFLVFSYLLPLIPFVVVFDGYISSLRTRTPAEVQSLLRSKIPKAEISKWKFLSGEAEHTWPIGWCSWIICYKDE